MAKNKFKVGDKVVIKKASNCQASILVGKTGVVEKADKTGIHSESDQASCRIGVKGHYDEGEGIWFDVRDLVLDSKAKKKPITHVVIWTEDDDPSKIFTSEKDAKDFIKGLTERHSVRQDSIYLVTVKSVKQVEITKSLRLKEHKVY